MIGALRVFFDLRQRKPRRLHFTRPVKPRLVQIVRRSGVSALTKDKQRSRTRLSPKLDHAYVSVAEVAIATLLTFFPAGVEVEDDAKWTSSARHRQTGSSIAERFTSTRVHSLESVDLTPRHLPRAPVSLQYPDHRFERTNPRPRRGISRGLNSTHAFK